MTLIQIQQCSFYQLNTCNIILPFFKKKKHFLHKHILYTFTEYFYKMFIYYSYKMTTDMHVFNDLEETLYIVGAVLLTESYILNK